MKTFAIYKVRSVELAQSNRNIGKTLIVAVWQRFSIENGAIDAAPRGWVLVIRSLGPDSPASESPEGKSGDIARAFVIDELPAKDARV